MILETGHFCSRQDISGQFRGKFSFFRAGDVSPLDETQAFLIHKTFLQVLTIDTDEVQVKFLEPAVTPKLDCFRLGDQDDISWESTQQILAVLTPPEFMAKKSTNRVQYYKFNMTELKNVL